MPDPWAPVPRLDPERVVDRLAAVTGVALCVEGRPAGGEVGAAYLRWPDGRRSVLTMGSPSAGPLVELARSAGLPAPRYELTAEVEGAFVVQVRPASRTVVKLFP
jgi:hypothetical protein